MSFRSGTGHVDPEPRLDHGGAASWPSEPTGQAGVLTSSDRITAHRGLRIPPSEAERLRHLIESAIGEVFGVAEDALARPSRGKARVARARQTAMYLAHVSCGLSLTDVGQVFSRDRTTVAHACAVIEDRRDDPAFDRALELMEWIVPTLIGRDLLHTGSEA